MPILPREAEISSEDLFDLDPVSLPWIVAHVRSRFEKSLARHLFVEKIPFYLPQVERVKRDGRQSSFLPLFAGYVFLRGLSEARRVVWRSGVEPLLIEVDDQQTLTSELRQIRALQLAGASLEPVTEFVPGGTVRITEGVFRGYSGIVVNDRGQERIIVRLSLVRRQIAVEFPSALLTPLRAIK